VVIVPNHSFLGFKVSIMLHFDVLIGCITVAVSLFIRNWLIVGSNYTLQHSSTHGRIVVRRHNGGEEAVLTAMDPKMKQWSRSSSIQHHAVMICVFECHVV
jgi:hypothetical protein